MNGDAKTRQFSHHLAIKICDRTRPQLKCDDLAVAALDEQFVIDEIKLDLKDTIAERYGGRRQPACRHIERNIPPMINKRRQLHPDLSDDLRPHVQCRESISPFIQL